MNTSQVLRSVAQSVDSVLMPIEGRIAAANMEKARLQKSFTRLSEQRATRTREAFQRDVAALDARLDELHLEAAPLQTLAAAGKWTRFVLVMAGHMHLGTHCSTLRWNTSLFYMPEFSGADEAEVVELAGERACTVCFPSAPVDRPSMLPVDVAAREQARVEREAKAIKLDSERNRFMRDDRQEVRMGDERFKTLRAAENHISRELDWAISAAFQDSVDPEHAEHLRRNAAGRITEAKQTLTLVIARRKELGEEFDAEAFMSKKFANKVKENSKYAPAIPGGLTLAELEQRVSL